MPYLLEALIENAADHKKTVEIRAAHRDIAVDQREHAVVDEIARGRPVVKLNARED